MPVIFFDYVLHYDICLFQCGGCELYKEKLLFSGAFSVSEGFFVFFKVAFKKGVIKFLSLFRSW